jgi:lipopolysaccharide export system protein LptC
MNPKSQYARHARHARRMRVLKVGLPLIALAILSSLFLFSRSITMDGALPYAELDIEDRLREPKMSGVRIATTADNGAVIDLTADTITPKGEGSANVRNAHGTITALGGTVTTLAAPQIDYDEGAAQAALTGGVTITASDYAMTTEALDVAIEDAQVQSRSNVRAVGPLGQLDAGLMTLTQQDGKFVLVFNSGVRLLYDPTGKAQD